MRELQTYRNARRWPTRETRLSVYLGQDLGSLRGRFRLSELTGITRVQRPGAREVTASAIRIPAWTTQALVNIREGLGKKEPDGDFLGARPEFEWRVDQRRGREAWEAIWDMANVGWVRAGERELSVGFLEGAGRQFPGLTRAAVGSAICPEAIEDFLTGRWVRIERERTHVARSHCSILGWETERRNKIRDAGQRA